MATDDISVGWHRSLNYWENFEPDLFTQVKTYLWGSQTASPSQHGKYWLLESPVLDWHPSFSTSTGGAYRRHWRSYAGPSSSCGPGLSEWPSALGVRHTYASNPFHRSAPHRLSVAIFQYPSMERERPTWLVLSKERACELGTRATSGIFDSKQKVTLVTYLRSRWSVTCTRL